MTRFHLDGIEFDQTEKVTPNWERVSCPLQHSLQDIPVVKHDIRGSVLGFHQLMRILQLRDRQIAPFHINNVPVTPHVNPITKMSSCHIIRVWDSQPPAHIGHHYVVDLLMLYDDKYFAAFRRQKLTLEQIEAGAAETDGWGRWFKLSLMKGPSFLNATEINVSSAHGDAD
ncbi:hypothetical protein BS78_02G353700 [Paspalum vaginatum]|nr:hypothetical protein BS78_02G353700 [Paspalum vaginatum]